MKITPLEIRQKSFEKNFRGYDKDEVAGYLQILSQEWEKLQDENKELSIKLKGAEREVEKLREVENSLFKTLKTAEDTGANIMDQANKAAELHMRETELKAEALLNDAKNRARNLIEEAELQAKESYDEVEGQLKALAKLYHTLQDLRDDLISDIKTVTSEVNQKLEKAQKHISDYDVDRQLIEIRKSSMSSNTSRKKDANKALPEKEEVIELPKETPDTEAGNIITKAAPEPKEDAKPLHNDSEEKSQETPEPVKKKKQDDGEKSFFDEIE